jgi:type I restriction enzyme, S subunit
MEEVMLMNVLEEIKIRNKEVGDIPVRSVTNEEGFCSQRNIFSKNIYSKDLSNYKVVKKGEFAYNPSRINVGSIDYLREEIALVSPLYVIFKCSNKIYPKYLKYFLKGKKGEAYIRSKARGAVRDTLSFKSLGEIALPLPDINIQKEIVKILDSINKILQKRKEQLLLLDDYLKSVFMEMFGDPVSNYKNWEFHKLGKFTSYIGSGSTPLGGSSNYQKSGIIFIRSQNVLMNKFDFSDVAYIPMQIHENMKRTFVKKNDILFNITGASIGRVAVFNGVDDSANVNQHVCIIRLNNKNLNPLFLSHFIAQPTFQTIVISRNSGATRQAFNFQQIKNFNIYLPPIELQNKFAAIVNQTKDIKQKMQESLNEMNNYFNSSMQRYFE